MTTAIDPKNLLQMGLSVFTYKKSQVIFIRPKREDLKLLAGYAEEGLLKPVIEKVYAPEEMPGAHQRLETEHVAGNLL